MKKASHRAKVAICEVKPLVFFRGSDDDPGPKSGSRGTLKNDVFRKGASKVVVLVESKGKKKKTCTITKHIP